MIGDEVVAFALDPERPGVDLERERRLIDDAEQPAGLRLDEPDELPSLVVTQAVVACALSSASP